MTEEMSGGLRHHSDEASGPERCGWIQHYRRKIATVSKQPVPARWGQVMPQSYKKRFQI